MSVPIRYSEQVIGLISLHSYQTHIYTGAELNDLKFLADICGEALNRIRVEQSLSESDERFRQIAENMDQIIWMVDVGMEKLIYINPAYERLFGKPVSSMYERLRSFIDSVHPNDRSKVASMVEARARGVHAAAEYRIIRADKSVRWIRSRSFPIKNADGITYRLGGTAEDITEEKEAEIQLRNFSRRLLEVQEKDRKHIAQELHDDIGQVLTAVRLNLQNLQNQTESLGLIRQIQEDIKVIDEAVTRVRNLSFELRPSLLDDLGLAAATRWCVERYARRAGIKAHVEINSEIALERVSRDVETACFRILQESLTNIARHAKARNVYVVLSVVESNVVMSVKDDGIGMEQSALKTSIDHASTLGLRGMEERALAAGGHLEIISAVGRGTELLAVFSCSDLLANRTNEADTNYAGRSTIH